MQLDAVGQVGEAVGDNVALKFLPAEDQIRDINLDGDKFIDISRRIDHGGDRRIDVKRRAVFAAVLDDSLPDTALEDLTPP